MAQSSALAPELIAELACSASDRNHFEHEVLAELGRHIGFDIAFFVRPNGVSDVSPGLDRAVLRDALPHWQTMSEEIELLKRAASASGGVVVDAEVLGVDLERCTYYQTIMRPHRGHCTLFGFLAPRGVVLAEVVLGRAGRSQRFSTNDRSQLRALIPTLSLATATLQHDDTSSNRRRLDTNLTGREREVLSYLALGYTNAQIACALGTRERTVRNQLSSAYRKLGVASRAEAVGVLGSPR